MKKLKVLLILAIGFIPFSASANSIHCSAPGSVESGETFAVTFSGSLGGAGGIWLGTIGSEGNAQYQSGSLSFGGEETQNFSRTIYYKAGNPGSARFYAYDVDAASDTDEISTSDTCTVTIVEATQSQSYSGGGSSYTYEEKSNNNYLKSITAENVTLNQTFDKETLEYRGVVSGDIEKTNIQAETEDGDAWIEGLGEKELVEGVNRFEIKVHAANDEERVYVLEITRKEKNPIEVIINKRKYTVFKKESNVKPPEGFVKTNVVIDKQDVVAYTNEYIDYILVLLVDDLGDSSFYIYNAKNSTYVKYTEVKSKDLRLVFVKPSKVPMNYKKTKLKLDDEVEAYALSGVKDFRLVYAINLNNGEEGFYQYDMKEKTFQRYNNKLVSSVEDFSKKLEIGLVAAGALIIILIIIVITQASSKSKMRKAIKNKKENEAIKKVVQKEEKKEIPKEEKKEEPKAEEKKTEEPELSKKELKRLQKEEKKRLKKEQDDFLN